MGISRLEPADFANFLSVARLFTGFVRATHEERAAAKTAAGEEPKDDEPSPFACISATMGWETFHLVHMLWLSQLDIPDKSDTKDWELQVRAPSPDIT